MAGLRNIPILNNPGFKKYPPCLLCVDGDEYKLDLNKTVAIQDFSYMDYYDTKN